MDYDFRVILQHYPALLAGLEMTVIICTLSLAIGCGIGLFACFGKLMRRGPFFWICAAYIDLFRTLPEMVTIFWIYACLPLVLDLTLSSFVSGMIALSLFSGAFSAEIFRGGIAAVPKGQKEAARALGLPTFWVWWSVILPQAVRIMIPAFITLLTDLVKASGLLSAISVTELVYQATLLSGSTFRYFEFFTAVGIAYFFLIFPLSVAAQMFQRRQRRQGY